MTHDEWWRPRGAAQGSTEARCVDTTPEGVSHSRAPTVTVRSCSPRAHAQRRCAAWPCRRAPSSASGDELRGRRTRSAAHEHAQASAGLPGDVPRRRTLDRAGRRRCRSPSARRPARPRYPRCRRPAPGSRPRPGNRAGNDDAKPANGRRVAMPSSAPVLWPERLRQPSCMGAGPDDLRAMARRWARPADHHVAHARRQRVAHDRPTAIVNADARRDAATRTGGARWRSAGQRGGSPDPTQPLPLARPPCPNARRLRHSARGRDITPGA
jgi:hypothetical protein